MSQRIVKSYDNEGKLLKVEVVETEFTSLKDRMQAAYDDVMAHVGAEPGTELAWIACNCCGADVKIDLHRFLENPELPAGWVENERGEFCPECVRNARTN